MFNFKVLALTTILALGGLTGGNAAQARGDIHLCKGTSVHDMRPCRLNNGTIFTPTPLPTPAPVYGGSNGIDSRCYSSTLGQYEVTGAWVGANCY